MYDVVIIGGGPAGLSAALYLARAKVKAVLLEKSGYGGQIALTQKEKNYPGIYEISGKDLADSIHEQGERYGGEFSFEVAKEIIDENDKKIVITDKRKIECRAIIIATGAAPKKAGFEGEEEFIGKGVSYCATCDGRFFEKKEVFVVGAGYSACQESIFLAQFASKVNLIVRKNELSCSGTIVKELNDNSKIQVFYNSKIEKVSGNDFVQRVGIIKSEAEYNEETIGDIEYENNNKNTKEFEDNEGYGVFVFVGYEPESKIAPKSVKRDENNYIYVDDDKKTSVNGIYAVGDVTHKKIRQVITSASDGVVAAKIIETILLK